MKNILIATDCSSAANNATAFAAGLADVFNAKLIVCNAFEAMPAPISELPVVINHNEMATHMHRELTDTARLLKAKYNIVVQTCVKTGIPSAAIIEAAKEHQADLVVVGMKYDGKKRQRVFGSTVTALIKKIQIPLLIVPEQVAFSHLSTLALAIESDVAPGSEGPLTVFKDLAMRFDSKTYLVHVEPTVADASLASLRPPVQLSKQLRPIDMQFECIFGISITKAIDGFIKQHRIKLLAMLPHHHAVLERLFAASTTRTMALASSIPLLLLPQHK